MQKTDEMPVASRAGFLLQQFHYCTVQLYISLLSPRAINK